MQEFIDCVNNMSPEDFEKLCQHLSDETKTKSSIIKQAFGNLQELIDDDDDDERGHDDLIDEIEETGEDVSVDCKAYYGNTLLNEGFAECVVEALDCANDTAAGAVHRLLRHLAILACSEEFDESIEVLNFLESLYSID